MSVGPEKIIRGWARGYLMGAPIARHLLDTYGSEHGTFEAYHPVMIDAGSMTLVAIGLVWWAQ